MAEFGLQVSADWELTGSCWRVGNWCCSTTPPHEAEIVKFVADKFELRPVTRVALGAYARIFGRTILYKNCITFT